MRQQIKLKPFFVCAGLVNEKKMATQRSSNTNMVVRGSIGRSSWQITCNFLTCSLWCPRGVRFSGKHLCNQYVFGKTLGPGRNKSWALQCLLGRPTLAW
uniref:Uncharacterized protein n=1 Tax=Pyxicephalus adspersus TaxID=30357 RepID=A0AAV2ZFY0_PYXAD|nr:TPA: hypothetical protein GDO54_004777 [Pyxicephalus adspersus]